MLVFTARKAITDSIFECDQIGKREGARRHWVGYELNSLVAPNKYYSSLVIHYDTDYTENVLAGCLKTCLYKENIMSNNTRPDKPKLDTEDAKDPEKAPTSTITSKRVEDYADKLADKVVREKYVPNRFGAEKKQSLGEKMQSKIDGIKEGIMKLVKLLENGSKETGDQSAADRRNRLEALSADAKAVGIKEGIVLAVALKGALQSNEGSRKAPEDPHADSEKKLMETIPISMRVRVDDTMHLQRTGVSRWEDVAFFSKEDLQNYKGQMSGGRGGVIAFIDRQGSAWVTGDSPNHRQALQRAGYSLNPDIKTPFSNGEKLSEHESVEGEKLANKWERIMSIASRDREKEYERLQQERQAEAAKKQELAA